MIEVMDVSIDGPVTDWPRQLVGIYDRTLPGDRVVLDVPERAEPPPFPDLADLVVGGGCRVSPERRHEIVRSRSLPDTVGPGMRLLVCGLNPSEYAADAGVGFARPGNRFWPAAIAAGLVVDDRDPMAALERGVGMTDLVKRATPRAAELRNEEYRAGLARVTRLVALVGAGSGVLRRARRMARRRSTGTPPREINESGSGDGRSTSCRRPVD